METTTRRVDPKRSIRSAPDRKQIAVRMSGVLFAQLKMQALKEKTSLQKKMMDYIEVGLQVDRDWDSDEPERHEKKPDMTIWDF